MRTLHRADLPPKVRNLMSRTLAAVDPRQTLVDAAAVMRSRRVSSLAVLDGDRIVGIITERDLMRAIADERVAAETHVSEYMNQEPLTIEIYEPIELAASMMLHHRVRHLLVTDRGRLAGCISVRDLLTLHPWPRPLAVAEPW